MWIIDFGEATPLGEAALYEAPFERVKAVVRPRRLAPGADPHSASIWWLHQRPRPDFRAALKSSRRYIATIRHSKHRLFVWADVQVVPDSALIVFARDDDYTFGVLHSRVHELWALATGTQLETRPRYTPTTTFETFPLPRPTHEQREPIAAAARELVRLRDGWLDPPGLDPDALSKRTLTNLYNQRPTWLANAHDDLDRAVLAAYGWPPDQPDDEILARLLALNLEREPAQQKGSPG
jgi:type II restriction/modification system DNA methylase subunit YeeA